MTPRLVVHVVVAAALLGCEREDRDFRTASSAADPLPAVRTSGLQAGPATPDPSIHGYDENRWAVGQGQRWYTQFNCAGCHSPGGGGGMGPPLNDADWIYGSDPENIVATIIEGRPNGMPSFRGRIARQQLWQLAAYVRSISGLTPKDTWSARTDAMQETTPAREPAAGTTPP